MKMAVSYWDGRYSKDVQSGLESELMQVVPAQIIRNASFRRLEPKEYFECAYLPEDTAKIRKVFSGRKVVGIQDGGRSNTLDKRLVIGDQEFAINVKGSGAWYESRWRKETMESIDAEEDIESVSELITTKEHPRIMISGAWYLDSKFRRPLGGQRYDWALDDLSLSDGVFSRRLGMYICPVIAVAVVPQSYVLDGVYGEDKLVAQEIRLLPSNVRMEADTGINPLVQYCLTDGYKRWLSISSSAVKTTAFIENLVKTAIQICTLPVRSAKKCSENQQDCVETLYYDAVRPTKDGVIAADGKMYFADLEGIETKHFQRYGAASDLLNKQVCEMLDHTLGGIHQYGTLLDCWVGAQKYHELVNENLPSGLSYSGWQVRGNFSNLA